MAKVIADLKRVKPSEAVKILRARKGKLCVSVNAGVDVSMLVYVEKTDFLKEVGKLEDNQYRVSVYGDIVYVDDVCCYTDGEE